MPQEKNDDWFAYAKELAKAERELQIEHWVYISFEMRNNDGTRKRLHKIDIPRYMLDKWLWVIDWRKAKLICQNPRQHINAYYSYYDKRSGLDTGLNSLLNKVTAAKAQITRIQNIIDRYIRDMKQNNMFFNQKTDERLLKLTEKLIRKQENYKILYSNMQQQVEQRKESYQL